MNHLREGGIGIFDSGIGGLTVWVEVRKRLPSHRLIYLGDTARVPYGNKSPETVLRYAKENAQFLVREGVGALIIACNTASALGSDVVRSSVSMPVIEVIGAGARVAARTTLTNRIAVIGTEATIRSGAYRERILKLLPEAEVLERACPLFVPLVEEGWFDGEVTRKVAEDYLAEVRRFDPDTVILGCTHYPLLTRVIGETLGSDVNLVDSAVAVGVEVEELVAEKGNEGPSASADRSKVFLTDASETFRRVMARILGDGHPPLIHVDNTGSSSLPE